MGLWLSMHALDKMVRQVRPHLGNIFWSNCNTAAIAASGLVASIVFVRFGSKELYGQYLFVLALVQLFSLLSVSGTRTVVLRAAAQSFDGVYRAATRFSFLRSLFAVPLLIVTGIIFYHTKSRVTGIGIIVAGAFFPFVTSIENWMSFLKGRAEFSRLARFNGVRYGTSLLGVSAAIVFGNSLLAVLLVYFLVHSAFNAVYYLRSRALLRNADVDPGWRRQSYALTIMELSSVAFGQVDILLVAALLPIEQVAIYGLVMRLVGVFLTATKSTVEGILPQLFRSHSVTVQHFYRFFLLSLGATAVLAWLIRYPILWMYGSSCAELVPYVRLYVFVIPAYFLSAVISHFMIKYQMNRQINYARVFGIVTVVVLYAVLIPAYGVWGGVIASILFFVVQMIVGLRFLQMRRPQSVDERTGEIGVIG